MPYTPNAKVVRDWLRANFSTEEIKHIGVTSCRKISGSSTWSQHSWSNALDVHITAGPNSEGSPEEMLVGDRIAAGLDAEFGSAIRYILWRRKAHYDHIHVDFWPRGYGMPPCAGGAQRIQWPDKSWEYAPFPLTIAVDEIVSEGGYDDLLGFSIGLMGEPSVKGLRAEALQRMLLRRGEDLGEWGPNGDGVDGSAGDDSRAALASFQSKHGISDEPGVVGSKTYDVLFPPPVIVESEHIDPTARAAATRANQRLDKLHSV